jgi:hypothetical protein
MRYFKKVSNQNKQVYFLGIVMESKSSAHFENLNLNFAEVHNKRFFTHYDSVIDTEDKNYHLTALSKDYYIEKEKQFFIKGGGGDKKTVKFVGLDYDKIFNEIKEEYKKTTGKNWDQRKGPRVDKEQVFKEMVINTKSTTTIEDIKKLSANLQKMGIKVLEVSVHNDEGHILEDGSKKYNYHCHVIFANVNSQGHYKRWQKKDLEHLQNVVADSLDMERGQKGSKSKRLSAQQYKKVAANKSDIENKVATLEKELKATKKVLSMTKSENEELATYKYRFNNASDTIKELEHKNNELEALFESLGLNEIKQKTQDISKIKKMLLEKLALEYNQERDKLKQSQQATQKQYSELKKDNDNKKELIQSTFKTVLTNNVDNVNNSNKNNKNIDIDY